MPIYEWAVLDEKGEPTGERIEKLMKYPPPQVLTSTDGRTAKLMPSNIARTGLRWGDTHRRYDIGLGTWVTSQRDIDRICYERGLVPVSDIPPSRWITAEESFERQARYNADTDRQNEEWHALAEKHGVYRPDGSVDDVASAKAWEEFLPAGAVLGDREHPNKPKDFKEY